MNNLTVQQRVAILLLLESSSSDSSSSDSSSSDDNSLDDFVFLAALRQPRTTPRLSAWWTHEVPEWTDERFKQHFRVSRASFDALSASLAERWVRPGKSGRTPMSCDKALAICLWRLANTTTYRRGRGGRGGRGCRRGQRGDGGRTRELERLR
jgi:hypothetical protein